MGIVYDPFHEEIFSAIKGKGGSAVGTNGNIHTALLKLL